MVLIMDLVLSIPQFIAVEYGKDYQMGARITRGSGGAIYHAIASSSELKSRCTGFSIVAKKLQCKSLFKYCFKHVHEFCSEFQEHGN